jgi:hypothetical protein
MNRHAIAVVGLAVLVGLGWLTSLALAGNSGDSANAHSGTIVEGTEYKLERDPEVPILPFDDNPDPNQCGIPIQWGDDGQAWLTGMWEGELLQQEVLVYDSHLRLGITGSAPHGSEVQIALFQENPVLDYYFVKIGGDNPQEGWVPEPFLSFTPVL